ncbi:MAG: hypothetical protein WC988_02095 [Patescibacteria group bacterium]
MIKNKNLIYGVAALMSLVVLFLFVWNNYQIQVQERSIKPIKLPPQISGECGMQNCHGMDITCGSNVPQACDYMYKAGDNCRQFASCQTMNDQCILTRAPKFDSCKSCVEKCQQDSQDDQIKFFQCESKCAE